MSCFKELPDIEYPGYPFPPYHPNCMCTYPDMNFYDDGDGGNELEEKRYFIIVYRKIGYLRNEKR